MKHAAGIVAFIARFVVLGLALAFVISLVWPGVGDRLRTRFGLQMGEEIHAGPMLTKPGKLARIQRNNRLTIIRLHLDELADMKFLNVLNVRVDKQGKPTGYDPLEKAWEALI